MLIRVKSNPKKIQKIKLPIIREVHNIVIKENVDDVLRLAQIEIELKLDGIIASGKGNKKTGISYGKPELEEFARRLRISAAGNKPDISKRIEEYFIDLKSKNSKEFHQPSTIIYDSTRQQQIIGLF